AGAAGAGAPCAVFVVVERPDDHVPGQIAGAVRTATGEAFRFAPRTVALITPDEVPRTPLGKVRRLALSALLADPKTAARAHDLSQADPTPCAGIGDAEIETGIARIWRDLLRHD